MAQEPDKHTAQTSSPERTSWRRSTFRLVVPSALAILLFWLGFSTLMLPRVEQALIDQKGEALNELAKIAVNQITLLYKAAEDGHLPEDSLKQIALNQLRQLRFGPSQQDYFWVHDTQSVMLMHPTMPQLVGTSLRNFPGPDSSYPIETMTQIALDETSSYFDYVWQYLDNTNRVEPKVSHVEYFAPWGWIIGNGAYLTDVKEEMATITSMLRKMGLGVSLLIIVIVVYMSRYNYLLEHRRTVAERERAKTVTELQEALERVKTLKGLLPICSRCKKVRDDQGYWQNVDAYISQHTDTEFSHGLCPTCHADQLEELDRLGMTLNPKS